MIGSVLARLIELLSPASGSWLVGGSCGLLLQGVALSREPRDLDLYADEPLVAEIYNKLSTFAVDGPAFSRTDRYESTLSHFLIDNATVELVGGFKVRSMESEYEVEAEWTAAECARLYKLGGQSLLVMPLAHELLFNLLRERPDRYVPIAGHMKGNLSETETLKELIRRNHISKRVVKQCSELLGAVL